jgi:uncharacterized damage-inducible protein DinB
MLQKVLIELYDRDLKKLQAEIEQFSDASDLWKTSGAVTNSAGNLALHITGNLKHFIGGVLGSTGYVRDRDAEFSLKGVPKAQLLSEIGSTAEDVSQALNQLTDADLRATYPIEVFGRPMTTAFFLVHLATHLNYHLGQINYHRRLIAGSAK